MDYADFIDQFLQFNEDRNLERTQAMLAPGCKITFPGGVQYGSQAEMVEAARSRYKSVKKRRDRFFVGKDGDKVTVTSMGRLYGENLHGVPFDGIRYVDVFVIENDLITEQMVWNDFAESGVLDATN